MSAAWQEAVVVAAVEIDHSAAEVYRANFAAPVFEKEIASLSDEWLAAWNADVWWLSPPCTPFTRKGRQRDLDDPRNRGLLRLIDAISTVRPPAIAIENVVGFETSATFDRLQKSLSIAGYHVQWCQLCPTELGWPNRRPRIYVLASQQPLPAFQPPQLNPVSFREVLAAIEPSTIADLDSLWLDPDTARRYFDALDRVSFSDEHAVTACFTRSYGRTLVRSGSWLAEGDRLRRFSPAEVAALLGFPATFRWPASISTRRRWQLLGNSLALPAIRHTLRQFAGQ